MKTIFISLILVLQLFGIAEGLPIIPGQVGPGIETTAGSGPDRSGGAVIHVTTLAATGPGSLREAAESSGCRVIVFDVSGYIDLTISKQINIRKSCVTIAGQTAPSPGITLKGNGFSVSAHDVLIQHIRIRVGDDPLGETPKNRDGIEIVSDTLSNPGGVYNVVLDHLSASWATDENASISHSSGPKIHSISIINSIFSEGLFNSIHSEGVHSMGFLMFGEIKDVLFKGNYFAHNNGRNPFISNGSDTLVLNNVIYNWGKESQVYNGVPAPPSLSSVVGNVYVRGPSTHATWGNMPMWIYPAIPGGSQIFLKGNTLDGSLMTWGDIRNDSLNDIREDASPNWFLGMPLIPVANVLPDIVANAGSRPADRDPVDTRVISDVQNGIGRIINSQKEVGGWPPLAENFVVAQVPLNPWEIMKSGYTRLEEWLHAQAAALEN